MSTFFQLSFIFYLIPFSAKADSLIEQKKVCASQKEQHGGDPFRTLESERDMKSNAPYDKSDSHVLSNGCGKLFYSFAIYIL